MKSPSAKQSTPRLRAEADTVRAEIGRVLRDERHVERPIEPESPLGLEIGSLTDDVAQQFLEELPKHCNMLSTAIDDALDGLGKLEPRLPFSGLLVARGLLEAAADLYWLSDRAIGASERVRRTFLIYLRQHETLVRQLEQLAARTQGATGGLDLTRAVSEGWASLDETATAMAASGFELRTSKRPGSRYTLGDPKPSIGELVDKLITDVLGKTGVNVYSSYSATAHAEGEGLGALLLRSDFVSTDEGLRYAYGFDDTMWEERVLIPASRAAAGAFYSWAALAYPSRLAHER